MRVFALNLHQLSAFLRSLIVTIPRNNKKLYTILYPEIHKCFVNIDNIHLKLTMMPLLDLTLSQTFCISSSELFTLVFFDGEPEAKENLDALPPS